MEVLLMGGRYIKHTGLGAWRGRGGHWSLKAAAVVAAEDPLKFKFPRE